MKLSKTSKLGTKSWSLQALETCPGSVGDNGELVPACSGCYATINCYTFPVVKQVRADNKVEWQGESFVGDFIQALAKQSHFRWFDSGDMYSLELAEKMFKIMANTPNTKHWLPTREYNIIKQYTRIYGDFPDNLYIRLSAMYPDKPVKIPASLAGVKNVTFSNVHTKGAKIFGARCIAPDNGGSCGSCRQCWTNEGGSYELH